MELSQKVIGIIQGIPVSYNRGNTLLQFLTASTLFIKKIAFSSQIQCVSCDSDECEMDIFLDFSAFVGNVLPWTIPRVKF